jgi:hypothetical protein
MINLSISLEIIGMYKELKTAISEENRFYVDLLGLFHSDFAILKASVLKYYIPMLEEFDPFFLEPSKYLKEAYQN